MTVKNLKNYPAHTSLFRWVLVLENYLAPITILLETALHCDFFSLNFSLWCLTQK